MQLIQINLLWSMKINTKEYKIILQNKQKRIFINMFRGRTGQLGLLSPRTICWDRKASLAKLP